MDARSNGILAEGGRPVFFYIVVEPVLRGRRQGRRPPAPRTGIAAAVDGRGGERGGEVPRRRLAVLLPDEPMGTEGGGGGGKTGQAPRSEHWPPLRVGPGDPAVGPLARTPTGDAGKGAWDRTGEDGRAVGSGGTPPPNPPPRVLPSRQRERGCPDAAPTAALPVTPPASPRPPSAPVSPRLTDPPLSPNIVRHPLPQSLPPPPPPPQLPIPRTVTPPTPPPPTTPPGANTPPPHRSE